MTYDRLGRPKYPAGRVGAVTWLAGQLEMSRQRVHQLLKAGRISGAWQSPAGVWMLADSVVSNPPYSIDITAGKRGPRMEPMYERAARRNKAVLKAYREAARRAERVEIARLGFRVIEGGQA